MWSVRYIKKTIRDMDRLDHSQRIQVMKAIRKVSANPLPQSVGGYGRPLGSHANTNLTGFFKIKLVSLGLRVVYTLVRRENTMVVLVVSVRTDSECYIEAEKRKSERDSVKSKDDRNDS